jgi:hypothetical protein
MALNPGSTPVPSGVPPGHSSTPRRRLDERDLSLQLIVTTEDTENTGERQKVRKPLGAEAASVGGICPR